MGFTVVFEENGSMIGLMIASRNNIVVEKQ